VFVTNWPGGVPLGGGLPDLPNSTTAGKGKPGGFIAPWLGPIAVGATATQIAGASTTGTDEGRLDAAMRSKLLNDGERTYQAAFYQNRMDLAGQNPNQTSDWLSSQAQRLAHQQTGMTAAGLPIDGANQWAAGIANRAVNAGAETPAAMARLQRMLDQPLIIELRMNTDMIQADVERRTDIQMRRGR
jgi:hypothetical protein